MQANCAMKRHYECQAGPRQGRVQPGGSGAIRKAPGLGWIEAQFSKTVIALLAVLAILVCTAERAFAFKGSTVHQNITKEGLGFLKPEFVNFLAEENSYTDTETGLSPSWHFDNCCFYQNIRWHINGSEGDGTGTSYGYREVQSLFQDWLSDPDRTPSGLYGHNGEVFERYGELLHPAQDFYAHSNWAELGLAGCHPESELFDTGLGEWWEPTYYYEPHPLFHQIIVAQGATADVPPGWIVSFLEGPNDSARGRIMRIQAGDLVRMGLVSGLATFPGTWDPVPPDYTHDTVFWYHDDEMNKDGPERPFYDEAVRLALRQTTHEWDRLMSLIRGQNGDAGVQELENATINYLSTIYLNASFAVSYTNDTEFFPTPNGSNSQPFRNFAVARHVIPASGATMIMQASTYAVGDRLGKAGQALRFEKWGGTGNVRLEK